MTPTEIEILRKIVKELAKKDVKLAVELIMAEVSAVNEDVRTLRMLLLGNVAGITGISLILKILSAPLLVQVLALVILSLTTILTIVLIRRSLSRKEKLLRILLEAVEDPPNNKEYNDPPEDNRHMNEVFWACVATAVAWIIIAVLIVLFVHV